MDAVSLSVPENSCSSPFSFLPSFILRGLRRRRRARSLRKEIDRNNLHLASLAADTDLAAGHSAVSPLSFRGRDDGQMKGEGANTTSKEISCSGFALSLVAMHSFQVLTSLLQ